MDLDGTVLDGTFTASPRTRTAVEAAEAAGIVCLIATGRMFQSARRIAATLGVTGPLIWQGSCSRRSDLGAGSPTPT
jgi:hydroxymethylpyrimidine pyrophosphatase-like HAD family hydrolase